MQVGLVGRRYPAAADVKIYCLPIKLERSVAVGKVRWHTGHPEMTGELESSSTTSSW